ncbi:interleukin 17a/f2 [Symphorus nematophorus]
MDYRDNGNPPLISPCAYQLTDLLLSDLRFINTELRAVTQKQQKMDKDHVDNMRLRRSVCTLMVCCSVFWVVSSSSTVEAPSSSSPPPPGCDSMLTFSSNVTSSAEGNGNIHSRSLSPWSWRSSTVKNRIPVTLWEAECSSSFCSSPNPGQTDGHNLNSVPVYQNILVLTRQDRGSCYTASFRSVAVGCTCVWARTDEN